MILALFATITPVSIAASLDSAFSDLAKDNSNAQAAAFQTIRNSPELAPDLIAKHLEDANPSVRIQCLLLVREMPDQRCFKSVAAHAQTDGDVLVREYAIIALAAYKTSEAMSVIRTIAFRSGGTNRITAIRYLSHVWKKLAVDDLGKLIHDPDPLVQINSARELARNGDGRGKELARKFLQDSNNDLRFAAVGTLRYIGDNNDLARIESLSNDPKQPAEIHFESLTALRQIHLMAMPAPERVGELAARLNGHERSVRRWAAEELARINSTESLAALKKAARDSRHPGRKEAYEILREVNAR